MENYYWKTEYYHADNTTTMLEYLDEHVDEDVKVLNMEGTYAEIMKDGVKYGVHASGNGDSFNHKITFEEI